MYFVFWGFLIPLFYEDPVPLFYLPALLFPQILFTFSPPPPPPTPPPPPPPPRPPHATSCVSFCLMMVWTKLVKRAVICTHQLHLLHWMNNMLIQKSTLERYTVSLLLKNYSLLSADSSRNKTKTSLWNTKNTETIGINEQNTLHTIKDKFRKD